MQYQYYYAIVKSKYYYILAVRVMLTDSELILVTIG